MGSRLGLLLGAALTIWPMPETRTRSLSASTGPGTGKEVSRFSSDAIKERPALEKVAQIRTLLVDACESEGLSDRVVARPV